MDTGEALIPQSSLPDAKPSVAQLMMQMFDFSMGEMLELVPGGIKKMVAKDAVKIMRGFVEAQLADSDNDLLLHSLRQSAAFVTELVRRLEDYEATDGVMLLGEVTNDFIENAGQKKGTLEDSTDEGKSIR